MAEDETCSSYSVGYDEDPGGTASRHRGWLLIEQPGAWGRNALLESKLPTEVAAAIDERRRDAGVRVLLIRRGPGPASSDRRRWAFARTTATDPVLGGGWFSDPAELLDLDLAGMASGEVPVPDTGVGAAGRRLHPWSPRPVLCRQRSPRRPAPASGRGGRVGVLARRRRPVRRQRRLVPPRPVPRPGHPGDRARRWSTPTPRAASTRQASGAGRPGHPPPSRPRSSSVTSSTSGASMPSSWTGHDHDGDRHTVRFSVGGHVHEVVVDVVDRRP